MSDTQYAGDLLADLHKHDARYQTTTNQTPPFSLYGLAADRIEALEAVLAEINQIVADNIEEPGRSTAVKILRAQDAVLAEVGKG